MPCPNNFSQWRSHPNELHKGTVIMVAADTLVPCMHQAICSNHLYQTMIGIQGDMYDEQTTAFTHWGQD